MKKHLVRAVTFCFGLTISTAFADPNYKILIDPTMALADYANIQIDRAISSNSSLGLMLWHRDSDSWVGGDERSSAGVRYDWFENGVFDQGWHTNLMVKADFESHRYARTRLKMTQSFQFERDQFFINLGIGAQLSFDSHSNTDDYGGYQSWLLPAWEISIGRSF